MPAYCLWTHSILVIVFAILTYLAYAWYALVSASITLLTTIMGG